jgi:quinol monooxygenase YgiN
MFISLAQVDLVPAHRDAYLAQMIALARRSLESEPGTLRYQIIQDAADPNRIHVVEGYRDRAAFEAHMHGEGSARFLAAYAAQPEEDGRLRVWEATTGATAGYARLWSGTTVFPTENEG